MKKQEKICIKCEHEDVCFFLWDLKPNRDKKYSSRELRQGMGFGEKPNCEFFEKKFVKFYGIRPLKDMINDPSWRLHMIELIVLFVLTYLIFFKWLK